MSEIDQNEETDYNSEANYDSDAISNRLNDSEIEEVYKIDKYSILSRKIKNLLSFNADGIDIDQYFRSLKKIREDEESPHFIFLDYPNNDLVNKEYQLSSLLSIYNEIIKETAKPGFMNQDEINEIISLFNEINDLRDDYIESEDDNEPLFSGTLDEIMENLIYDERKTLIDIAKNINKLNKRNVIDIPKGMDVHDESYNEFYNKVLKSMYTGNRLNNKMNVTSLTTEGSNYNKFEKSKLEKLLQLKKEIGKSYSIKISDKEKNYFSKRELLKNLMMKMDENDLIGCAINAEVYHEFEITNLKQKYQLNPSIIEKIKKLKPNNIQSSQPVITKGLRRVSLQKLKKEFNNPLVNTIENDIFELSNNDFNEYSNKVNDIIFILSEYPKFKILLDSGKVSTKQLVLFEKEIAFETLVNKVHIKSRRNVIKRFKTELKNNKILNKVGTIIASNLVAKRLELLIYDISTNNQIYNIYYNKVLKFINEFKNNLLLNKIDNETIITFLKSNDKKIKLKVDYSKFDEKEILALISQEKQNLEEMLKNKNIFQKDVLTWNPPTVSEKREWGILKSNLKKMGNEDIAPLINFRTKVLYKYSLPDDQRIKEINNKIASTNKRLKILKKELKEIKTNKEDVSFYDNPEINYKNKINKSITFKVKKELLNEVIQAYKRKSMVDAIKIKTHINKVIVILELLDLNNALNQDPIVQKRLLTELAILGFNNYLQINNYYYNLSFKKTGNPESITFIPGQSDLVDFYGTDLNFKLYNSNSVEDFYDKNILKNYNLILPKKQIEPEHRKLKILYNPYTGQYGDQTGYLFDVYKLDKDLSTGLPLIDTEPTQTIDPRTNQIKYSKIRVEKPGKFNFIKLPIQTNKKEIFNYKWIEVPLEKTKMYTSYYDSCSRFTNESDCNKGKGIGNSKCVYDNIQKVCKASYNQQKLLTNSFGKKKLKSIKPVKKNKKV